MSDTLKKFSFVYKLVELVSEMVDQNTDVTEGRNRASFEIFKCCWQWFLEEIE